MTPLHDDMEAITPSSPRPAVILSPPIWEDHRQAMTPPPIPRMIMEMQ